MFAGKFVCIKKRFEIHETVQAKNCANFMEKSRLKFSLHVHLKANSIHCMSTAQRVTVKPFKKDWLKGCGIISICAKNSGYTGFFSPKGKPQINPIIKL